MSITLIFLFAPLFSSMGIRCLHYRCASLPCAIPLCLLNLWFQKATIVAFSIYWLHFMKKCGAWVVCLSHDSTIIFTPFLNKLSSLLVFARLPWVLHWRSSICACLKFAYNFNTLQLCHDSVVAWIYISKGNSWAAPCSAFCELFQWHCGSVLYVQSLCSPVLDFYLLLSQLSGPLMNGSIFLLNALVCIVCVYG